MKLLKVKLRKDKDYVYCYLKERIIQEEDCDYYEHNMGCDRNGDFWGRTHRKGSNSGICCTSYKEPLLNSCQHCLEEEKKYEEYRLPEEASKIQQTLNRKNLFDKLKKRGGKSWK